MSANDKDIKNRNTAELSDDEMKAFAAAYARYLREHDLEPGDEVLPETPQQGGQAGGSEAREPGAQESGHAKAREAGEPGVREHAAPEDAVLSVPAPPAEPEPAPAKERPAVSAPAAAESAPSKEDRKKAAKKKKQAKKQKKARAKKKDRAEQKFRSKKSDKGVAAVIELHDRIQDSIDEGAAKLGRDFARALHSITSTYRNSRRSIGMGILAIAVIAAGILIVFDHFTIYEYAYNGKVLGYVNEQDEVTDVLDVAGREMTKNSQSETGIEFVANQNVTFNMVDARGKSTDDADTAVNKLIYLTDIETEAYGIYDGDRVVAVVKDSDEAEDLLLQAKAALSVPDNGMELVSSDFTNDLDIRPINVLLNSVQSEAAALRQMTEGGEMETFHIIEEGESVASLAEDFGVEPVSIYAEDNKTVATDVEQGDKVCIHSTVEPVSVEMVEHGRMKEVIEYKTIKKDSDKYYQGDTYVEQEGENRVQIFEGTITKVAGEVEDRDEESIEVIKEGRDKIILVGTKERPKTAPTGTYVIPIQRYVVTSEFGGRWGRMHEGIDLGASTGTPIYATDGGTVLRAEYYSGYGLCVDIDHENGRVTRYGHCSRLLVSKGDRVYQGQNIALVGNTGHSFGSHLHFEVRMNGTPTNPRKYLSF